MRVSDIPSRQSPSNSLRVLTHNIYGGHPPWHDRRRLIADGVRTLAPDLMTFQETIITDDIDQVVEILGPDAHIVHSSDREPDGQGISIASRWPIGDVRELDLNVTNRTGDFACTALMAEIDVPPPCGPVLFVNHFPDWQLDHEHERELQAVVVAKAIEEIIAGQNMHVVLAGDLDADPDAASVRFLTGKQSLDGLSVCYRNAWESAHPGEAGHTFSTHSPLHAAVNWDWPFRQIDHILVRCGEHGGPTLAIDACELAFNTPVNGIWASDHFAVVADLMLPKPGVELP